MPPFLRIRKLTIQPEQSLASSPSPHNHSSIANNARMPSYSRLEHVSIAALPTHQRQPHQQEATGLRRSSRIVRGDGQNGAAEGYTSFESAPPFHISQVPARSLHAMPPAAPVNADRLSSRPLSRQSGSSPRSRHSGSRAPAPPALTLHTALSADELSHHRQHGQARGQLTLPTPPLTAVKQRGVQGKSRSGGSGSYARPKTRSEKTRQPPKEGTCLHCGCDHTQAKQWRSNPLPGATKDDQLCSKCGIYASSHMKRRPASLDAGNRSFSADVPRSSGNSIGPIRPRSAAKACRKSRRAVSAAVPTTSRRSSASSSPRKSTFGPLSSAPLCSARLPSLAESVYDSADAFSQAQSSSQELPSPMDSAYPITPISALGPLLPSPAVISSANGWPYREELSLGGHLSSKSDVAKYPSSLSRAAHVMQPSSSAADPSLADICPCRIEEGDTWYTLIAASRIASAAEEAQTVPRLLPVPVAADTFAQIDRSDSSLSPAVARRMMSIADLCGGDRAASSGGMDVDGADAEWKEDVRRGGMLGRAERESSDAAEALLQIQHSSPRSSSPLIDLPASYRTSPPYCPSSLPTNAYTQAVSVSQPTRPHSSRPSVSRWPSYKHQDLRPSHYYNEPQGLVRPQPILPVATQGGRDLPSLASLFPRTSSGVGARAVSGLGMQGGEGVRRGSARLGAW